MLYCKKYHFFYAGFAFAFSWHGAPVWLGTTALNNFCSLFMIKATAVINGKKWRCVCVIASNVMIIHFFLYLFCGYTWFPTFPPSSASFTFLSPNHNPSLPFYPPHPHKKKLEGNAPLNLPPFGYTLLAPGGLLYNLYTLPFLFFPPWQACINHQFLPPSPTIFLSILLPTSPSPLTYFLFLTQFLISAHTQPSSPNSSHTWTHTHTHTLSLSLSLSLSLPLSLSLSWPQQASPLLSILSGP